MRPYGTPFIHSYRSHAPSKSKKQIIDYILYAVSFGIYSVYFDRLQEIWSDKFVTLAEWENMLQSFVGEFSDSNLLVGTDFCLS